MQGQPGARRRCAVVACSAFQPLDDDMEDAITGADSDEVECWWCLCLASKPNAVQWKPKQERDEETPEVE